MKIIFQPISSWKIKLRKKSIKKEQKKNIRGLMVKPVKPANQVTWINMLNSRTGSWNPMRLITCFLKLCLI
jgi:hypothetical protein